jgi:hypothetical protein
LTNTLQSIDSPQLFTLAAWFDAKADFLFSRHRLLSLHNLANGEKRRLLHSERSAA